MAQRRILILENEQLSSGGIQSLLSKQENLHVQATIFNNWTEMLQDIDDFKPDVIVMYDHLLETITLELANFLKDYPSLRTVVIHSQDNEIEIYDSQKVLIEDLADFLAII